MTSALAAALTRLWQGMAGIFTVLGVIALLVWCLARLDSRGKR